VQQPVFFCMEKKNGAETVSPKPCSIAQYLHPCSKPVFFCMEKKTVLKPCRPSHAASHSVMAVGSLRKLRKLHCALFALHIHHSCVLMESPWQIELPDCMEGSQMTSGRGGSSCTAAHFKTTEQEGRVLFSHTCRFEWSIMMLCGFTSLCMMPMEWQYCSACSDVKWAPCSVSNEEYRHTSLPYHTAKYVLVRYNLHKTEILQCTDRVGYRSLAGFRTIFNVRTSKVVRNPHNFAEAKKGSSWP
jgi:hypothetical protein